MQQLGPVIIYEPKDGQTLDSFAAELVFMAWMRNSLVAGRFDGITVAAAPGVTRRKIVAYWHKERGRAE
jgi:hypothetical protein